MMQVMIDVAGRPLVFDIIGWDNEKEFVEDVLKWHDTVDPTKKYKGLDEYAYTLCEALTDETHDVTYNRTDTVQLLIERTVAHHGTNNN